MSLLKNLKEPFPFEMETGNHVKIAGFFGVFIFFFLLLFKPFELDRLSMQRVLLVACCYSASTIACILLSAFIIPRLFPSWFIEHRWTTGRQLLFMLFTIFLVGLTNFLISPLLLDTQINLGYAWWFQGITLVVAVIPVSIFILAKQNLLLRKFSGQASEIEIKLQEKKKADNQLPLKNTTAVSENIILVGDYQKEILELAPADLYFISSASNYIKVFHRQQDRIVYSILRGTLKKAEEILQAHPNFFKCHRAYIVNLDKVEHIEGNAQGYKIKIDGFADLIPVSRNLNNEFGDKLLAHKIPRA